MTGHPIPGALLRCEKQRLMLRKRQAARLIRQAAAVACEACRGTCCPECQFTGLDSHQEAAQ